MRLDKLTIGTDKAPSEDGVDHHRFKNLKDVTIDFDQGHWVTVVIGWNGTGKSNALEALAIIFRDLIAESRSPAFAFQLAYRMGSDENMRYIHIDADPDREKNPFIIHVATDAQAKDSNLPSSLDQDDGKCLALRGKAMKLTEFLADEALHLPRYVFSYYSGESSRMHDIFISYLKKYYNKLLYSGGDPAPKRLFYALPVHSQFVLLAFLINSDQKTKDILLSQLGIDLETGVESVLFVLRDPPWDSKVGDPRFWNARGLVQRFLNRLMNVSLAPISVKRRIPKSERNKNNTEHEFKYLYIKDIESLRSLVGNQPSNEFFRDLESTYVSDLIEEVRIRVKKNGVIMTFHELSEGEQQFLTVLGLLRFTAESESLFLLDEPDTHLNPKWSTDYLHHLKLFVGKNGEAEGNSHIVMTTHNPLAIAELVKEQVQILYHENDKHTVCADNPEVDPKGMGFAGIVTSDMFGLGTSLDKATNDDLLELHKLSTQQSSSLQQRERLEALRSRLERLDFNFASADRMETEYMRARFDLAVDGNIRGAVVTDDNKKIAVEALVHSLLSGLRNGRK
jgi:predicted ATPase